LHEIERIVAQGTLDRKWKWEMKIVHRANATRGNCTPCVYVCECVEKYLLKFVY